jgi:hypothetical protein
MSGSQVQIGLILLILAIPPSPAKTKPLVWQSGQIVSLKEDTVDREGDVRTYVYSLRTKNSTYLAVFSSPLKAYIHSTVRFAVDDKSVYVQDLDGRQRKACIMEPPVQSTKR